MGAQNSNTEAHNKTVIVGSAAKGFMCPEIRSFKTTLFLKEGMLQRLCINSMELSRLVM
jgi:hypothetical protein